VRCALPGASCGKRMISSTIAAASNHHRGRYASPALAIASYPFVDLPPGNILQLQAVPVQQVFNLSIPKSCWICYNTNKQPNRSVFGAG